MGGDVGADSLLGVEAHYDDVIFAINGGFEYDVGAGAEVDLDIQSTFHAVTMAVLCFRCAFSVRSFISRAGQYGIFRC